MTTTTRAAALGVFAALMLAIGVPRTVGADWHPNGSVGGSLHNPKFHGDPVVTDTTITIPWKKPKHWHTDHYQHGTLWVTTVHYPSHIPSGCVSDGNIGTSPMESDDENPLVITDLWPGTRYTIQLYARGPRWRPSWQRTPGWTRSTAQVWGYSPNAIVVATTGKQPSLDECNNPAPEPETPTPPEPETPDPEPPTPPEPETPDPETPDPETPDPETPDPVTPEPESPEPETPTTPTTPEPETPDPEAQSCTYEHRLTAVPGTTGAGFSSHIIITSKDSKATAKLRAYQAFNGAPLDVLDSEGNAVGATTSLTPANSAKTFQLEGARGWHTVIVEHPTKASMDAATVAMRLREPDAGVSVVLAERIEHCDPAPAPTAPDLVMRDPQALLWPQTFDWRASVVNIGDAAAAPTTVRVYSGARLLDSKTIDVELAAGAEWPMSDYISRDRPAVGDVVRICVAPVPGEAVPDHANNCASATVERN